MPEHQQIQQSKRPDTIFQKQPTPATPTQVSNPYSIIQRAKINPKSLTHADIMQLQRTIGNRAVDRLLSGIGNASAAQQVTVQRQEIPEEEEPLQGKFESSQMQEIPEEEKPLQGKIIGIIQRQEIPEEEEPLQGKTAETIQRQEIPEEEEPLQGKRIEIVQRQEKMPPTNNTGLPDNLKIGIENLSSLSIDDVKVHYNSCKPAQFQALAYAQGTDIHVAPGQEKYLPHEAWHVVQQKQGRVKTKNINNGVSINDDSILEDEADYMGAKAKQLGESTRVPTKLVSISDFTQKPLKMLTEKLVIQRAVPMAIGLPKPNPNTGTYRAVSGEKLVFDSAKYPRSKFSFGSKTRDEVFMRYNPQIIGNRVTSIRSTSGEQVNVAGVQLDHHFSWDNIAGIMTAHNNHMKEIGKTDRNDFYTLWDAKMYYNDQNNLVPALASHNAAAGAAGVSVIPRINRGLEIYQGQIQTSWMNLQAGLVSVGEQMSDEAAVEIATLLHNIAQAMNDVTDRLF